MFTHTKGPLTAAELSLILNISESTVKKLVRNKELPCGYTKNHQLRFDLESVLKYFRELEGGAA
jgi:hypothetical protein